jgi:hypothetical protein
MAMFNSQKSPVPSYYATMCEYIKPAVDMGLQFAASMSDGILSDLRPRATTNASLENNKTLSPPS